MGKINKCLEAEDVAMEDIENAIRVKCLKLDEAEKMDFFSRIAAILSGLEKTDSQDE